MATSPVLQTPRLRIEPFADHHLTPRYVSWLNDPEVVRYSEQRGRSHTLESCRAYWQSFVQTPNYFWALVTREVQPRHIGNMNAHVDPRHRLADVGILIGERRVWNQGYGLEAWQAVCRYLLTEGGMRKVTAGTLSVNIPMLAIMKRADMVPDGRRLRHYVWNGQEVDIEHFALFREMLGPADAAGSETQSS
jgi:RimJ/RimL family protein N-acetyltransferase